MKRRVSGVRQVPARCLFLGCRSSSLSRARIFMPGTRVMPKNALEVIFLFVCDASVLGLSTLSSVCRRWSVASFNLYKDVTVFPHMAGAHVCYLRPISILRWSETWCTSCWCLAVGLVGCTRDECPTLWDASAVDMCMFYMFYTGFTPFAFCVHFLLTGDIKNNNQHLWVRLANFLKGSTRGQHARSFTLVDQTLRQQVCCHAPLSFPPRVWEHKILSMW